MTKNFKRFFVFLLISGFLLFSFGSSYAVTKIEFLSGLLNARGIDWSESHEFQSNNPAGFLLRTGYVTDTVNNLKANITRAEALRWIIQSLGLSFEANLLADYPTGFDDENDLTDFERGCLVLACNMNPAIFERNDKFKGKEILSPNDFETLMSNVRNASQNFTFDIVRNPIAGLRVFIHREGVPTGIPQWRAYLDGIKTKPSADAFKNSLESEGIEASVTGSNGAYGVRTQKLENYDQIRRLETIANARGLNIRVLPSMTNTNTRIVPKFWVILRIDPSYYKILPLISQHSPNELLTLSELSDQNKSIAAINAGFFSVTNPGRGFAVGALKINGNFISEPYDGRGILAWNNDDEAIFSIGSEEVKYWDDMQNIIQAGPLLLDEGFPANHDEGFNNSLISARHPRSAVGLNQNGEWIFIAVDGRNGMHSSGATISELTDIMRSNGILYALNLDGGGSTEIIINDRIYNMPSEGRERKISYALGVIEHKN